MAGSGEGIRTLEGNHSQIITGLEFDLHVRPFSSGVKLPLDHTVSTLLIRIARACQLESGTSGGRQGSLATPSKMKRIYSPGTLGVGSALTNKAFKAKAARSNLANMVG